MKTIIYKGKEYEIYRRAMRRLVLVSETGFIIVARETIENENRPKNYNRDTMSYLKQRNSRWKK